MSKTATTLADLVAAGLLPAATPELAQAEARLAVAITPSMLDLIDRNDPADQRFLFLDFGLPTQRANPMISNAWGNGTTVMVYDRSVQPLSIFEKEIRIRPN